MDTGKNGSQCKYDLVDFSQSTWEMNQNTFFAAFLRT